jgi:hypothetical protein
LAPGQSLGIQIVDVGKPARGEEGVAYITDGPFYAPFISSQQLQLVRTLERLVSKSRTPSIPSAELGSYF